MGDSDKPAVSLEEHQVNADAIGMNLKEYLTMQGLDPSLADSTASSPSRSNAASDQAQSDYEKRKAAKKAAKQATGAYDGTSLAGASPASSSVSPSGYRSQNGGAGTGLSGDSQGDYVRSPTREAYTSVTGIPSRDREAESWRRDDRNGRVDDRTDVGRHREDGDAEAAWVEKRRREDAELRRQQEGPSPQQRAKDELAATLQAARERAGLARPGERTYGVSSSSVRHNGYESNNYPLRNMATRSAYGTDAHHVAAPFGRDAYGHGSGENRANNMRSAERRPWNERDEPLRRQAKAGSIRINVKKINMLVSSETGETSVGLGESTHEYFVQPRENIYVLKTLIYYDVGWAPRNQRLIFNRGDLLDETIIEEIGLRDSDTISLLRNMGDTAMVDTTVVCQPCQQGGCSIS